MKNVGKIDLESGTVRISDPCYDRSVWCCGTIENVKKGEWNCFVRKSDSSWGIRNASIIAVYGDINPEEIVFDLKKERADKMREISGDKTKNLHWELADIHVGVDSGQAGIFDENKYRENDEDWYDENCHITLHGDMCGTLNGGFVSQSGFGDGSYDCFVARQDGEIVAIQIEFIREEIEEEI